MSKYDFELDLEHENSLTAIIKMLKPNSKILEFGPANGRLTKYLKEKMNSRVDIVEIDEEAGRDAAKYSEKQLLGENEGDIEKYIWLDKLGNEQYDFIIFADVLEHLRNPELVLKKCDSILKENGEIIFSTPNIAHNSIIIDLINDEFKYNKTGLLDDTHIKFFTYKSLMRMLESINYVAVVKKAIYWEVGKNEIDNTYESVSHSIAKEIRKRKYSNIYQFVFKIKRKSDAINDCLITNLISNENYGYEFECYIKEKNQMLYDENKTIIKRINPADNIIEVDFKDFKNIEEIRIDPLPCNCLIKVNELYTIIDQQKINIVIKSCNGTKIKNDMYLFETNDPQIYLDLNNRHVDNLHCEIKYMDYDSDSIKVYASLLKEQFCELTSLIEQNRDISNENKDLLDRNNELISKNNKNAIEIEEKIRLLENNQETIIEKNNELENQKCNINELNEKLQKIYNSRLLKIIMKLKGML